MIRKRIYIHLHSMGAYFLMILNPFFIIFILRLWTFISQAIQTSLIRIRFLGIKEVFHFVDLFITILFDLQITRSDKASKHSHL